jgi:hypothetical protein
MLQKHTTAAFCRDQTHNCSISGTRPVVSCTRKNWRKNATKRRNSSSDPINRMTKSQKTVMSLSRGDDRDDSRKDDSRPSRADWRPLARDKKTGPRSSEVPSLCPVRERSERPSARSAAHREAAFRPEGGLTSRTSRRTSRSAARAPSWRGRTRRPTAN